jgi:hypothetical protein
MCGGGLPADMRVVGHQIVQVEPREAGSSQKASPEEEERAQEEEKESQSEERKKAEQDGLQAQMERIMQQNIAREAASNAAKAAAQAAAASNTTQSSPESSTKMSESQSEERSHSGYVELKESPKAGLSVGEKWETTGAAPSKEVESPSYEPRSALSPPVIAGERKEEAQPQPKVSLPQLRNR